MKIMIDARESGTTTGRYIDKLIENLKLIDNQNSYYLLLKTPRLNMYEHFANNFQPIECNIKEFTFAEQFRLLKVIDKIKPDLVHFGMVQQPILYKGPVVTTMHDLTTLRFTNPSKNFLLFKFKQLIYRYVNKVVAEKSKQIITPSNFVKRDIISFSGVLPNKITVTYEAADRIEDDLNELRKLKDKKFLLYVGRHQPHKNLARLINSHQKLLDKHKDIFLVIAGKKDKTTEKLEKNIFKKGLKNIIFTGFVKEGELKWLYENCFAYVFPSLSEGFGLPGLEAMIHGAPVISSSATCLPEIYGNAAIYFDPLNEDDMSLAIEKVILNKELRLNLINKGYAKTSEYSWKRMAEQTLAIYKSAIKNKNT